MKKKIYKTKNGYYYNLINGRLFYPSNALSELIDSIDTRQELLDRVEHEKLTAREIEEIDKLLFEPRKKDTSRDLDRLILITAVGCNMRCKYCYADQGTYGKTKELMTFNTAVKAIDEFFGEYNTIKMIFFFGGEPLLNYKLIEDICNYVKMNYSGRYQSFNIMSNLLSIPDNFCDVINKYNIKISTSLDGTKICNDENRIDSNGKGTYDRVVKNINIIKSKTNNLSTIEATLTGIHNKIGFTKQDVVNYIVSNFNVKFVSVQEATPFEGREFNVYKSSESTNYSTHEAIDLYLEKGTVTDQLIEFLRIIQRGMKTDFMCNTGFGQMAVMANGDVYPCQLFVTEDKEFFMGNVFQKDFRTTKQKVQNKLYQGSRAVRKECKECEIQNYCFSCIAGNYKQNKVLYPTVDECKNKKDEVYTIIEEYSLLYSDKNKWEYFKKRIKEDKKIWALV